MSLDASPGPVSRIILAAAAHSQVPPGTNLLPTRNAMAIPFDRSVSGRAFNIPLAALESDLRIYNLASIAA